MTRTPTQSDRSSRSNSKAKPSALRPLSLAVLLATTGWPTLAANPLPADALPRGLQVVQGQAQLSTQGAQMTVRNTNGSILNWQEFSIGRDAKVYFEQANSSSKVLNRVIGNDPSQIFGQLGSNGQVWLLNPNGVLFGRDARVDVGSLVVSTLRLNDQDFLSGQYRFSAGLDGATLRNEGALRSSLGGQVVLLSERVENAGQIETPQGNTSLAAARSVELVDTGAPNLSVRVSVPAGEVINLGQLRAHGGSIDVHAASVNQQGLIRADRLTVDGQGQVHLSASDTLTLAAGSQTRAASGSITLEAGSGTTWVSGSVDASSATSRGGEVLVLGPQIGLLEGARIDASGATGGGRIRVGGGAGGLDTRLPNARAVYVAPKATLLADAGSSGNGGQVLLWSNEATRAYGNFSARGGATGGDGGLVETSGGWLDARPASIQVQAPLGRAGTWLLDPNNILIGDSVGDSNISGGPSFTTTNDNSTISTATIAAALNAGNSVSISTAAAGANTQAGDITIDGMNLVVAPPTSVSLGFVAERHIGMSNSVIRSGSAPLSVSLSAATGTTGSIAVVGSTIETVGGNVLLGSRVLRPLEWEGTFTQSTYNAAIGDVTAAPFAPSSRIGVYLSNSSFDLGTGQFFAAGGIAGTAGDRGIGIQSFRTNITARSISLTGATGTGPEVPLPAIAVQLGSSQFTATDYIDLYGFGGRGVRTSDTKFLLNAASPASRLLINGQGSPSLMLGTAGLTAGSLSTGPLVTATGGTVTIIGNRSAFITNSGARDRLIVDVAGASAFRLEGTNRGVSLDSGIYIGPSNGTFDLIGPLSPGATEDFSQIFNGATIQTGGSFRNVAGRLLISGSTIRSSGVPLDISLTSTTSRLIVNASTLDSGGGAISLRAQGGIGELPGNYGDHAFGIYLRDSQITAPGATGRVEMNGVAPDPDSPALAGPTLALTGVGMVNSDIQATTISITGQGRTGNGHNGIGVAVYEGSTLNGTNIQLTGTGANDFGVRLANNAGSLNATQNLTLTGRELSGTSATIEVDGAWRLTAGDTLFLDGTGNSVELTDSFGPTGPRFVAGRQFHLKFTEREPGGSVVPAADLTWLSTLLGDMPAGALTRITAEGEPITFAGLLSAPSRLQLAIDNLSFQVGAGVRSTASGDAVVLTGSDGFGAITQFSNSAGAAGIQTPNGRWLAFFNDPRQTTLGGLVGDFSMLNLAANPLQRDGNGNFVTPLAGNAIGYSVSASSLAGSALQGSLTKVYDATSNFLLDPVSLTVSGLLAGDRLTFTGAGTANASDKNVGANKAVTVGNDTQFGVVDANGKPVFGYNSPVFTASITPRNLQLTAVTAANKVYDAATIASLTGQLSGVLGSDSVATSLNGQFVDKNAGANKSVNYTANLTGTDAGNYFLLPATASGTTFASITPRNLQVTGLTAANKVYDGSVTAVLSGTAIINVLNGDQVALAGSASGAFASKDVGSARPISVSGLSLSGGDAGNYLLQPVSGLAADIAPATLTFIATPVVSVQGAVLPQLSGTVAGFVGNETLQSATSGSLVWSTTASVASPAGLYNINGGGLTAANYRFVQAPGNAQALTLRPSASSDTPTNLSQTLLVTAALSTSIPVTMSTPISSRVLNAASGLSFERGAEGALGFAPLNLSQMSRSEVITLLAARDNYKKNLFADALHKLKIDPALADVRPCANEAELSKGQCLITESLKRAILQARELNAVQRDKFRKVKQAAVPAIERKVALLIGINDYVDRRIPFLMGAIPDARAGRTLLEDRLGYETILVENSSKETMLAALNKLALESGPNDSVMVYFAGHGEVVPSTGMGYWLPSDSRIDKPETWISNTDIARLISLIGAKQMMLISDSCYSGTLAGNEKVELPGQRTTEDLLSRKAVVILSSGGNEPVADEGKNGHSVFAYHLMNALRELGDWKAGSDVFERLRDAVRRDFPQTPQYGASREAGHQGNTDYLLERREIEKAAQ